MLIAIIIVLIVLWALGYGPIDINIARVELLRFNGHLITLLDVLIFAALVWAASELSSPFREIAAVLLVVWVLSVLGIIAIAGLSNLLIIAIIVGLILYLLSGKRH